MNEALFYDMIFFFVFEPKNNLLETIYPSVDYFIFIYVLLLYIADYYLYEWFFAL